jgi:predicted  nucleic acid-binding Zn-ribbon protein
MTRVSALWHLQTLDHERDEKRRRAEQVVQTLAHDPKLAAAHSARTADQNRLAQLHAELQDAELQAKSLDAKIKQVENQLSSGQITNPKELDALEKDRQMHLRHRGDLDTKILELMDTSERAQKSLDAQDAALKKTQASSATESQHMERERDALAARLAELDPACAAARAELDSDALSAYDRLRQSKAGRVVARLKNDGCAACGVQIASGLVSRVEDGEELVFCSGCGRILAA